MGNSIRYEAIPWEKISNRCSPDAVKHLKQSLTSLEAGRAPTPSFKLYGKTDVSLVENFIDTYVEKQSPDWNVEYERSRLSKFGPQGGFKPWSELQELVELYVTRPTDVSHVEQSILRDMKQEYGKLKCAMLSVNDALVTLIATDKINDRAAGDPTFNLKKTDKKAQEVAKQYVKSGKWTELMGYVFSRFTKQKPRIFMPLPFASMLAQAQWYVPFLTGIQDSMRRSGLASPFVHWSDKIGFEACFSLMGEEIANMHKEGNILIYVQGDFEKMDTTTGSSQYNAFVVPTFEFAFHSKQGGLAETMLYTTNANIITPAGMITQPIGTASGAEVTNGGETICNDYYQRRLLQLISVPYTLCARRVNGDDSTFVFSVAPADADEFEKSLVKAADQASTECGFRTQADKWRVSREFGLYCQNVYYYDDKSRSVIWWYPAALILNSIINPEKQYNPADWDKDYRDIDVIEKLDNGSREPYFHSLVDYVARGMRYPLLGSSENETKRILSKYERYRSLQPLDARFNRQDYDIAKSPTVKYILENR